MDDLTVRTGRVVDGKFYTDSVADQAVRDACAKGSSQAAPQSPESAMEALGFKPKPPPHDEARSDTNHPTRPGTFRGLESGQFQGCGFKGFWVRVVRGLFAASLGARGATAAFVHNARGVSAAFLSNARGVHFQTPAVLPVRSRSFVSSSVREQVGSLLCRSGRSEVRRCNARVPCAPLEPLTPCALPAANSPAFSVDSCTALIFGSLRAMGGFTQWAGRQKGGGDGHRAAGPGSRGGGSSRREPTPKTIGAAAAVPRAASPHPVVAAIRRTTGREGECGPPPRSSSASSSGLSATANSGSAALSSAVAT